MRIHPRTCHAGFTLLLCCALSWPATTRAAFDRQSRTARSVDANTDQFAVDMTVEQDGQRHTWRRYVSGTRTRMEVEFDGQKFITVELGDAAGTTYTLMPGDKRAMKMTMAATATPGRGRETPPVPPAASNGVDDMPPMELLGAESINGKRAQKYLVKMAEGDGFIWLEDGTELPLRMQSGGTTVEMTHYDFTTPGPELFQVPKGYEVMDMDRMMRSMSAGGLMARGALGMATGRLGAAAGGSLGGAAGAAIGSAFGGPIGAMVGQFLGNHFGKKAGQKVGQKTGAAAGGAIH